MVKETRCEKCKETIERRRDVIKLKGIKYCKKCYRENWINHRKVTKRIMFQEKEKERAIFHIIPKEIKIKTINLNKREKNVLFKLLTMNNLSNEEATERIERLSEYERNMFKELNIRHKDKINLNKQFKEGFLKLTQ
jgi:DNA-directed RNA polymerase subunit M/transcription elongation factor TFIIS